MNFSEKNTSPHWMRGTCLLFASLALIIAMGIISPSYAADRNGRDHEDRWQSEHRRDNDRRWNVERRWDRPKAWREHEREARRWQVERRYYRGPEVIHVPPPVYYAPPDPSPGINIVIPLRFR